MEAWILSLIPMAIILIFAVLAVIWSYYSKGAHPIHHHRKS